MRYYLGYAVRVKETGNVWEENGVPRIFHTVNDARVAISNRCIASKSGWSVTPDLYEIVHIRVEVFNDVVA